MDAVLADISTAGTGSTSWELADELGSVRDVVSAQGTVIDHIQYDSFGNIMSESSPANGDRFKYAQQQADATGLNYDRARYYNPVTGRFISQDPTGFGGGDVNLYRYCGNSPASNTDPTGLQSTNGYYSASVDISERPVWIASPTQLGATALAAPLAAGGGGNIGPGFKGLFGYYVKPWNNGLDSGWWAAGKWSGWVVGAAAGAAAGGLALAGGGVAVTEAAAAGEAAEVGAEIGGVAAETGEAVAEAGEVVIETGEAAASEASEAAERFRSSP